MDGNKSLYTEGIYDLRAVPTIYLLDKKKRVLLKDCQFLPNIEGKMADGCGENAIRSQ
jgi:hypothetical protein